MPPLPALEWQRRVVLQERPDLRRGRQDVLERARHYADDGIARVIERDLAADDRGVATEAPSPQPVAEDRHPRAIGTVVGSIEALSDRRRRAQHTEVARAHALTIESLGLGPAGQRRLPGSHHRERFEGTTPLPQLAVCAEGYFLPRAAGAVVPNRREPVGMRKWERLEQNRIHRAEDRRAGADAQTERQRGDQREAGILQQHSQSKSQVLKHLVLQSFWL